MAIYSLNHLHRRSCIRHIWPNIRRLHQEMINFNSLEFRNLIRNWCETQRIKECNAIKSVLDDKGTRNTRNFYRNPILNQQIEELAKITDVIESNITDKADDLVFDEQNQANPEIQHEIAQALVEEQNKKLSHLHQKLRDLESLK